MRLFKTRILAQNFRDTSKYVKSYGRSKISSKTQFFAYRAISRWNHRFGSWARETIIVERIKIHLFFRYIVYKKVKNTAYTRRFPFFLKRQNQNRPKMQKFTTQHNFSQQPQSVGRTTLAFHT